MNHATDGPWYAIRQEGQDGSEEILVRQWPKDPHRPSRGILVAEVPDALDRQRAEANARLIQVCPQMRDALEAIAGMDGDTMSDAGDAVDIARETLDEIEQAEVRTP